MKKFKIPSAYDYDEAIRKMQSRSKDDWRTDMKIKNLGLAVPLGMYYYSIPSTKVPQLSSVIGNCNAVHSCYLSPFLNVTNMKCFKVKYDTKRFGKSVGAVEENPELYRIDELDVGTMEIATLQKYKNKRLMKNLTFRSSNNESRLLNFPYSYGILTDYMNTPMEVRYHLCKGSKTSFRIICDSMVSDKGSYLLGVEDYKNDQTGALEGITSTAPTEIPVSSSAYSQWSSTQKAQSNQELMSNIATLSQANQFTQESTGLESSQAIDKSRLDQVGNIASGIGSLLSLNFGGVAQSGINLLRTAQQREQTLAKLNLQSDHAHRNFELAQKNAIGYRNAQIKDIQNTPRSMMSTGSDVLFSLKKANTRIDFVRYSVDEYNKERLGLYFAMFGYKLNRVSKIDIYSRIDYNYIKTVGCNIVSKRGGRRIPKDHLRKLSEIFDSGITFWHVTRGNRVYLDYRYENYETKFWEE